MEKFLDILAANMVILLAMMVPISIVAIASYYKHKRVELIHQERMAAIEKGIMPQGELPDPDKEEEFEGPKAPPNYMRRGLLWLCPGMGAVVFSVAFLADVNEAIRLPILGTSILCAGVGAAYLVIYFVESEKARTGLQ